MSGPGRLRHRFGAVLQDLKLWNAGDTVCVAVSGGLDSIVLLDLLTETTGWHGGELSVATISHGVHPQSDDHALFVQAHANSLGLPCHRADLTLGDGASESACRAARFSVFSALPAQKVALAHHLNDQSETLLLQLLRGAGSRGLGAMRATRDRYVRPLLTFSRAELEKWASYRGLTWVADPTNRSPRFLRNRVRQELLPLLEELRPGALHTLGRAASHLAEDDDLLQQLAAPFCAAPGHPLPTENLTEQPPAIARRVVAAWIPGAKSTTIDSVLRAAAMGRGTVVLSEVQVVSVSTTRLVITQDAVRFGP